MLGENENEIDVNSKVYKQYLSESVAQGTEKLDPQRRYNRIGRIGNRIGRMLTNVHILLWIRDIRRSQSTRGTAQTKAGHRVSSLLQYQQVI